MITAGWRKLLNVRKAHWFDEAGRSLCGRWLFLGNMGPVDEKLTMTPDSCRGCARKLGIDMSEPFNG